MFLWKKKKKKKNICTVSELSTGNASRGKTLLKCSAAYTSLVSVLVLFNYLNSCEPWKSKSGCSIIHHLHFKKITIIPHKSFRNRQHLDSVVWAQSSTSIDMDGFVKNEGIFFSFFFFFEEQKKIPLTLQAPKHWQ